MNKKIRLTLALVVLALASSAPAFAAPAAQTVEASCRICHFCSQPGGLCAFVWAIVIIAVLLLLTLLTGRRKRCPVCGERNQRKAEICPYCNYNFASGELPAIARHMAGKLPPPASSLGVPEDKFWREQERPSAIPGRQSAAEPPFEEDVPPPHAEQAPGGGVNGEQTDKPAHSAEPDANKTLAAKTCPQCGKQLPPEAMFCTGCGTKL